ncbi:MAG: serine acetyltransferase [Nocardioidaceae bacterium]
MTDEQAPANPAAGLALGELVRADLRANRGYPKSVVVLLGFRVAQAARARGGPVGRVAYLLAGTLYKLLAEWVLGVELPPSTPVGPGLRLRHGVGLVVNPHARIGANVMLRHGVTIGNRLTETDCPVIEDDVEVGAGAILIGAITIGRGALVGAGAVVSQDVPAGAVVLGPRPTIRERD